MVGPARLPLLDRDPPSRYMPPILPRAPPGQIPAKTDGSVSAPGWSSWALRGSYLEAVSGLLRPGRGAGKLRITPHAASAVLGRNWTVPGGWTGQPPQGGETSCYQRLPQTLVPRRGRNSPPPP